LRCKKVPLVGILWPFFVCAYLPKKTNTLSPVGFDLTTHNLAGREDTTRPCHQAFFEHVFFSSTHNDKSLWQQHCNVQIPKNLTHRWDSNPGSSVL
jgi:hypothetical protein